MKNNKQKGFTLIELLVVISIIGLLSTLAVVSLGNARTKARDAKRKSDIKQVSTALELYNANNGGYIAVGTAGDADCATAGAIYETDNNDELCYMNTIEDGTNNYLKSIPQDPTNDATHFYRADIDTNISCVSTLLEIYTDAAVDDNFMCVSGSCFATSTGCL